MIEEEIKAISKKHGLPHIGSCLSILPILKTIYSKKRPQDKIILDCAHAHLAHLFFLGGDVEEKLVKYGIHCDKRAGCDVSGGSLGHALGIAIGMALTDRTRNIYCIVSDGSMMEGSNWEALRIKEELRLDNLKIHCNFNGYSAVADVDIEELTERMETFTNIWVHHTSNGEGFEGLQGHYRIL